MKHVLLPCPHCEFSHMFKRQCWWELEGIYIGLYASNDMKSQKSCEQELVFGDSTYEKLLPYLDSKI